MDKQHTSAGAPISADKAKKAHGKPGLLGKARDASIQAIARWLGASARWFGRVMNHHTRHWRRRQQRIFLVCFVIGTQLISFSMLFYSLRHPAQPRAMQTIRLPAPSAATMPRPRLTRQDTMSVLLFRRRLDSLMATAAGRDSVAAFSRARPGFIDSVLILEKQLGLNP